MPDIFRAALAQQTGHDRSDPIARIVRSRGAWGWRSASTCATSRVVSRRRMTT
jgi:hypothetical protein